MYASGSSTQSRIQDLGLQEQSMIAHWVSVAGGVGLIVYSLLTDYTFSVAKAIPFKTHLVLDSLAGLVLIALAFLLELDVVARAYLIMMGAGVLLVVAVTQTEGVWAKGWASDLLSRRTSS